VTTPDNPCDPPYDAYERRTPDSQYGDLLRRICASGISVPTRQGPPALTLMQQTTTYDLRNGFPLITERSLGSFWRKAIGELCAFINGATTVAELEAFGCNWWGQWASEEKTSKRGLETGSLGPGSYGGAFHDFPGPTGPFDQFRHLVEQITELPELRTHFVSPWIPVYQVRGEGKTPGTTIAPCHGWVHVRVLGNELHLHMFQRSADVPVGVPSNMIQYSALMLMLAQLTGYRPSTFYHTMSDAHIYADQLEHIGPLLTRPARSLPTVTLNDAGRGITDIHDFRPDHFELADYEPHPAIPRIPVAT
jgi:thymidylate synthase